MQKVLHIFVCEVTDIFNAHCIVSRHLPAKDTKLVVSKEVSDYFTKIVEPFFTAQRELCF